MALNDDVLDVIVGFSPIAVVKMSQTCRRYRKKYLSDDFWEILKPDLVSGESRRRSTQSVASPVHTSESDLNRVLKETKLLISKSGRPIFRSCRRVFRDLIYNSHEDDDDISADAENSDGGEDAEAEPQPPSRTRGALAAYVSCDQLIRVEACLAFGAVTNGTLSTYRLSASPHLGTGPQVFHGLTECNLLHAAVEENAKSVMQLMLNLMLGATPYVDDALLRQWADEHSHTASLMSQSGVERAEKAEQAMWAHPHSFGYSGGDIFAQCSYWRVSVDYHENESDGEVTREQSHERLNVFYIALLRLTQQAQAKRHRKRAQQHLVKPAMYTLLHILPTQLVCALIRVGFPVKQQQQQRAQHSVFDWMFVYHSITPLFAPYQEIHRQMMETLPSDFEGRHYTAPRCVVPNGDSLTTSSV